MNKQNVILGLVIATLTVTAFAAKNIQVASNDKDAKSVAWYTANIPVARDVNKQCYDNPQLQSSQDCKNSLHALEISYKGTGS